MRVIAGAYRSRPLLAPAGLDTRPTSDRLRETLFNVLTNGATDRVLGSCFLDLYAGSGAVGIEALSRGASQVTFVEQAPPAWTVLQKNLASLGMEKLGTERTGIQTAAAKTGGLAIRIDIEKRRVQSFLKAAIEKPAADHTRYGIVILDPPYELASEYDSTLNLLGGEGSKLLAEGAIVVAEHRKKTPPAGEYGRLIRFRLLEQGDAALSFYSLSSVEIAN